MSADIALGLMSGTSADGLTVCAVRVRPFEVLHFKNYAYTPALQQKLLNACALNAPALSELNFELGRLYAKTVQRFLQEFNLPAKRIAVIGSHGQTIYHGPQDKTPNTLQIGEPSFLACELGVPVISNFRAADMALRGQGAPLIPFFDQFLWGKKTPRILLNIGGISNLTAAGSNIKPVGFDAGPGNTLMDIACQRFLRKPFDKNGALSAKGQADETLVSHLLKQPFFSQKPPKSLDKNTFGSAYLEEYFSAFGPHNLPDLLATLNLFTAAAITRALKFTPVACRKEITVSGGGAFNKTLLENLRRLNPSSRVNTTQDYGLHPLAKESAAFAVMAYEAFNGRKNHCSRATGARKDTLLGALTLCK